MIKIIASATLCAGILLISCAPPAKNQSASAPTSVSTAPSHAVAPSGWKTYSGAWFEISYPQSFTPVPLQKSNTKATGVDSAVFVSPSHEIEFYVFSPQWGGHASALDIDSRHERITSKKISVSDDRGGGGASKEDAITDTWLGIRALDGSYVRFVHHQRNDVCQTARAFGVKCKDMTLYRRHKTDFDRFRKSLIQYGD
jgi:hypothetical protein